MELRPRLRSSRVAGAGAGAAALLLLIVSEADGAARRRAPDLPQCPASGTRAVSFARALDGGGFLTGDGTEVKLAGILSLGKDGENASRTESRQATDALTDLLRMGAVSLADTGAKDRYGRVIAQVFAGGMWVQGSLLRAGLVRAAPDGPSAPCAKQMLQAEEAARASEAGAWKNRTFAVRSATTVNARAGTFQIVEGTVTTSTVNRGRAYVNFGADYRNDFTVTIAQPDMRLFRQARIDVRKLEGKRVRVRGWVDYYNGPEMEISAPAAIEILDQATAGASGETGDAAPKPRRRRRAE